MFPECPLYVSVLKFTLCFFNICFYLFIQLCQFLVAELMMSCGMKTLIYFFFYENS